jgi:hypothetical protein
MNMFCRIIDTPLSRTNTSAKDESSREVTGPCRAGKRSFGGGGKIEASNEGKKGQCSRQEKGSKELNQARC